MDKRTYDEEIRRIKRRTYIPFGILVGLLLCLAIFAVVQYYQHSFTPEKWAEDPASRTQIVDDLLDDHPLVGLTQEEIRALLGENEGGGEVPILTQEEQWIYWMGPERGFISIDSEWLLVKFQDGMVTDYAIVTD